MHKPEESTQENETHKHLRDFDIQTYHQILAIGTDLVIVNKKENLLNLALFYRSWLQSKIERMWNEIYVLSYLVIEKKSGTCKWL